MAAVAYKCHFDQEILEFSELSKNDFTAFTLSYIPSGRCIKFISSYDIWNILYREYDSSVLKQTIIF